HTRKTATRPIENASKTVAAASLPSADDGCSFVFCELLEQLGQPCCDRTGSASRDLTAVHLDDRNQFAECAGAEHFVGAIQLCQGEILFLMRDSVCAAQI